MFNIKNFYLISITFIFFLAFSCGSDSAKKEEKSKNQIVSLSPDMVKSELLNDITIEPDFLNKTFLVFYNKKDISCSQDIADDIVKFINNYFKDRSIKYIELNKAKELRKDRNVIKEEVLGASPIMQILAKRFTADYYINTNLKIISEEQIDDNKYQITGYIELTFFESNNSRLIGKVTLNIVYRKTKKDEKYDMNSTRKDFINDLTKISLARVFAIANEYEVKKYDYKVKFFGANNTREKDVIERAFQRSARYVDHKLLEFTKEYILWTIEFKGSSDDLANDLNKGLKGYEDFKRIKLINKTNEQVTYQK